MTADQTTPGSGDARLHSPPKGATQDIAGDQTEEAQRVQEATLIEKEPLPTVRFPPPSMAALLQPGAPARAVVQAREAGSEGLRERTTMR